MHRELGILSVPSGLLKKSVVPAMQPLVNIIGVRAISYQRPLKNWLAAIGFNGCGAPGPAGVVAQAPSAKLTTTGNTPRIQPAIQAPIRTNPLIPIWKRIKIPSAP
jgi:hypothetical protein